MRSETVGVLDLRRNLSALLETMQQQPLMVHRYGAPWVCVVSDAYWQRHLALLDFHPGLHPLADLLQLQRQALPLLELPALHDQVLHHRLWHWFVGGGGGPIDGWHLPLLHERLQRELHDPVWWDALRAFARRDDVAAIALRSGGVPPRATLDACRAMTRA
ncbi:MAG: hypothetical protein GAK31_00150 [Stenotrophomonas maltophilia]|uniref:Prevent-host-death protein n=1 Tax=Stenotrophomonas maltophilia TaxID=40324 RepID=A0A7V8FIY0_STEMA|nr:MAG: hypothetical protein GAK31_00150 [Stenotrophomonas maltophilia]